jgi:hypothetical protein
VSEVDPGNAIPQGGHGLALRLVQGDKLAELAQTLAQGNRPVQVLPRGDEPGVGVDAEGAVFGLGEGRPSKYGGDATPCLRCPSRSRQIPNVAEDVRTVAREGLLWNIGRSQPDCTTTPWGGTARHNRGQAVVRVLRGGSQALQDGARDVADVPVTALVAPVRAQVVADRQ